MPWEWPHLYWLYSIRRIGPNIRSEYRVYPRKVVRPGGKCLLMGAPSTCASNSQHWFVLCTSTSCDILYWSGNAAKASVFDDLGWWLYLRHSVCFLFTEPGLCMNTGLFLNAHTEWKASGPWGEILWIWQKMFWIRIVGCTFKVGPYSFCDNRHLSTLHKSRVCPDCRG